MSHCLSARIGSMLLLLGAVTLVVIAVPSWRYEVPWRAFHSALPIWLMAALGAIGLGLKLLWKADYGGTNWSPERPGQRFRSAIVYSRDNCPLCDEAVELLHAYARYLPPLALIDIAHDSELTELYGTSIPVVEFDGEIHFRGRISEVLLRRLIRMTEPE